ncbi:unnamed protein product [Notodromas monacha]|uniref:Uncharacterized protein n=1 Tax=Notodromas monacha TaxID=399045 RepID=A0A7R9BEW4_9CRUS|nr:unnamed protein product [Notodromas monacha]CAG0914041.1 unnamed protein product [Notodromas monacha]
MAKVHVSSMTVLDNPSPFVNPLQFQVTFDCIEDLSGDLEWKLIYVGSAESENFDQVLDTVYVCGACARGPTHNGQEFVHVGYCVNNEFKVNWGPSKEAERVGAELSVTDSVSASLKGSTVSCEVLLMENDDEEDAPFLPQERMEEGVTPSFTFVNNSRLDGQKLAQLRDELLVQDKQEAHLKQLKAEGKDKEGLYEAKLRNRLNMLMIKYSLVDPSRVRDSGTELDDNSGARLLTKANIKDKKLQKLWTKAEEAGFTFEELLTLKQEFVHYQEKQEMLETLLADVGPNLINELDPEKHHTRINLLRAELKSEMKKFEKVASVKLTDSQKRAVDREGFFHPRVSSLWKLAQTSNFSADELESLRDELRHFEARVDKLEHLQAEKALKEQQKQELGIAAYDDGQGSDGSLGYRDERIRAHGEIVEQHQRQLQDRILMRHHSEL